LDSVQGDSLAALEAIGPEFRGGLSNHGPMTAEAPSALGRADLVRPWVEQYKPHLDQHPAARRAISKHDWREALGDQHRVGDVIAFFDAQLLDEGPAVRVTFAEGPLLHRVAEGGPP